MRRFFGVTKGFSRSLGDRGRVVLHWGASVPDAAVIVDRSSAGGLIRSRSITISAAKSMSGDASMLGSGATKKTTGKEEYFENPKGYPQKSCNDGEAKGGQPSAFGSIRTVRGSVLSLVISVVIGVLVLIVLVVSLLLIAVNVSFWHERCRPRVEAAAVMVANGATSTP